MTPPPPATLLERYYAIMRARLDAGILDCSLNADIVDGLTVDQHMQRVVAQDDLHGAIHGGEPHDTR